MPPARAGAIVAAVLTCCLATPVVAQLRLPDSLVRIRPPICAVGDADARDLSAGSEIDISPVPRRLGHLRAVESGKHVMLSGASDDKTAYLVTIRSKFAADTSKARPVCGPILWRPADGPLHAYDDRLWPGSIWEFELAAPAATPVRRVSIWRMPGGGEGQDGSQTGNASMFALACDEWHGDRGPPRRDGFAGRIVLEVDIPRTEPTTDAAVRAAVSRAILDAAALWVAACRDCRPDHLVLVQTPEGLYVRPALARWLRELDGSFATANVRDIERGLRDRLEDVVFLTTEPTRSRIKQLESYVPAPSLQGQIDLLCASPSDKTATTLASIREALCRRQDMGGKERAKLTAVFRQSGATYCGTDPAIIACRADQILTEFNSRDYRFRISNEAPAIGKGAIEMDFGRVLVHEMGHWIGLDHIERGNSIMASSADRARCIDETTIASLSNNLKAGTNGPEAFLLFARGRQRRR